MSGRQMSQTANFPGRQLSLQPNIQEQNVLGANCPERQLSGRQMSKAPNVGRQMSGRGLAGAICLPSQESIWDNLALEQAAKGPKVKMSQHKFQKEFEKVIKYLSSTYHKQVFSN